MGWWSSNHYIGSIFFRAFNGSTEKFPSAQRKPPLVESAYWPTYGRRREIETLVLKNYNRRVAWAAKILLKPPMRGVL